MQSFTGLKGEIDSHTIIVGGLQYLTYNYGQIIQRENQLGNSRFQLSVQLNLIDIYRTFHPTAVEYTVFLNTYRTLSRIDHMLGQNTSLKKFNKIKIISSIFSYHNFMKLEISNRKKMKNGEFKQYTLEKNHSVKEEIKKAI